MHWEDGGRHSGGRVMLAGVCAILAVVAVLCTMYVGQLKEALEHETERYLQEISQHVASMINYRVESTFQALEASAETYTMTGDDEHAFAYLDMIAQRYGFQRMGVVDLNGRERTTDGYSREMWNVDAVRDALGGRDRVSGLVQSPVDGAEVMFYAVPIVRDGERTGALCAAVDKEQMRELLSVESFGGEGYSRIVDAKGNYLVDSQHKNAPEIHGTFFDMLRILGRYTDEQVDAVRSDMEEGRSGIFFFNMGDGDARSLCYTKLDVEDWYLLSGVPTDVAGAKTDAFIRLGVVVNVVVVGLFLALLLLVFTYNRRTRRELEELALVDPVTGGMNRACFEHRAEKALAGAALGTYSLVSLDIVRFKLINDAYGSEAGNQTLKYVYTVLQRHLGQEEMAGRITGDVFSVLLHRRDRVQTRAWLEALAADVNAFNQERERKYFLVLCAGVYEVEEEGLDIITIQDRANVARKRRAPSKPGSPCACTFYSDVERQRMLREKEIDDRKELALSRGEFAVYLQPKVDLRTGKVSGAEALSRWVDPERGMLPPDEFIPAFEQNGFITRLDLYVFEEVCRMLRAWTDRGLEPVPISVNLSRVHLRDPEFLRRFEGVREKYRVHPALIEFEVTETMATEDLERLVEVIAQLHALGYRCALDDFGSGYSSLNILKEVPVDVLKLDKAFFAGDGVETGRGRFVVENVVDLARKLEMDTVSEGVENISQVEFLRGIGCDMVQGYVFSKPVPVEQFERFAFGAEVEAGGADREEAVAP